MSVQSGLSTRLFPYFYYLPLTWRPLSTFSAPHGYRIAAIPLGITSMFRVEKREKSKRLLVRFLFRKGHLSYGLRTPFTLISLARTVYILYPISSTHKEAWVIVFSFSKLYYRKVRKKLLSSQVPLSSMRGECFRQGAQHVQNLRVRASLLHSQGYNSAGT